MMMHSGFHTTKFFWNYHIEPAQLEEQASFHTTKFFWNEDRESGEALAS